jgi:alkanesulfonate monooxygenase SsuD/methylene tetrahydromethanopterin reductase-like flavin-dependent oxidoreductase (luciferase family)
MDPRVTTPADGVAEQFQLATKICDGMNASFASLEQVRAVRAQLKTVADRAPKGPLADAIAALDKKVAAFEGSAQRFGPQAAAPQASFARLNGQFGQLLAFVESADTSPTEPAQQAFASVQSSATDLAKNWDDLKSKDIAALNEQLRDAKLPAINLAAVIAPAAEAEGEDEP